MIDAGADVNAINYYGETALFSAVKSEEQVVRDLIEAGADVNVACKKGKTALFYASLDRSGEISKSLIEAGAEVDVTDNDGHTPLCYAIKDGNGNMTRALIKAGVDVNMHLVGCLHNDKLLPLIYATLCSNKDVISALAGAADLSLSDNEGKTALFYAVNGKMGAVQTLLDAGADVNITDRENKTPLFYAVQRSYFENIADALIDAGADVNVTDDTGRTPLFYAVEKSYLKSNFDTLIGAGADVNVTDDSGRTPLFYAVQNNWSESVITALIAAGADVNHRDNEGKTPLYSAIENPTSFVQCLLEHGADMYVKDDFNFSFLSFFVEYCIEKSISRFSEGLDHFMEKGLQVEIMYETILSVVFCRILIHTPKSFSADSSFVKVIEKAITFMTEDGKKTDLLENVLKMLKEFDISLLPNIFDLLVKLGADPNSADSEGNTALHYAVRLPFSDVPGEKVMELCQQLKRLGIRNKKNRQNESPLLFCLRGRFSDLKDVAKIEARAQVLEEVIQFLLKSGSNMKEITTRGTFSFHFIFDIFSQDSYGSRLTTKKLLQAMLRLLYLILPYDARIMVHRRDTNLYGILHLYAKLQLSSSQEYSETEDAGDLTFGELMKAILEYFSQWKARVNERNEEEKTPLHLCATWSAVKLLLEAGGRPNDVDASGCSPLLRAARAKLFLKEKDCFYPDVFEEPKDFWKEALKRGLDPWTADKNGDSVLKILLESNQFVLADALVEVALHGDHVQSDSVVSSLLMTVCTDSSTSAHWKSNLVEMILKARNLIPLLNSGQCRNQLPLHTCCENIVQPEKRKWWTPLAKKEERLNKSEKAEVTEESVHWTICKLLRSCGADDSIRDETGQTCMDIAKSCPQLTEVLMKPIDLNDIPVFIPWTSISERYRNKLAKVARRQESVNVDSFWYHKEQLASGSFGLVFAGINEKDGREVAIKRVETLRIGRREDLREISTLKALSDCEQVIRYLSYFEANHFSYVVLELMEGNLEECLDRFPFETEERVKHCKDVVTGLGFLHKLEILHRDLKPSNILYKTHPELRVKIADFGLSRQIDTSSTTVYGTSAGTRCWIAPEVLKSEQDHSKSSDIFACGLVLHYIMSAKRHPFEPVNVGGKSLFQRNHETEANMIDNRMDGWENSLGPEATHLVKMMLDENGSKRPSADEALGHPFFWTKEKKQELLCAVGNQPEFECPRSRRTLPRNPPLSAVETDLEARFGSIVKHTDWNDPGYAHMPTIYREMRRGYDINSAVELVRFVRNAVAHVSEHSRSALIRKLLLEDFVFLEYFPNLVMEVYKAVTTHGWDQTREEIKYAINK